MPNWVANKLTVTGTVTEKMMKVVEEVADLDETTTGGKTVIRFDTTWEPPTKEVQSLSEVFLHNAFRLLSWGDPSVADYGVTLVDFENGVATHLNPREAWSDDQRRLAEKYQVATLTDSLMNRSEATTGTIVIDGVTRRWEFLGTSRNNEGFVIEGFVPTPEQHQEIYEAIVDELQTFPWNIIDDDKDFLALAAHA